MNLDDLAASAQRDQAAAVHADVAATIAGYYRTLRRGGVPRPGAFALTLQYQAAPIARIFGLEVCGE